MSVLLAAGSGGADLVRQSADTVMQTLPNAAVTLGSLDHVAGAGTPAPDDAAAAIRADADGEAWRGE